MFTFSHKAELCVVGAATILFIRSWLLILTGGNNFSVTNEKTGEKILTISVGRNSKLHTFSCFIPNNAYKTSKSTSTACFKFVRDRNTRYNTVRFGALQAAFAQTNILQIQRINRSMNFTS